MKPQVLILISHFLPGTKIGGPLASNLNIINNLNTYFDFSVITSSNDNGETKVYDNVDICKWNRHKNYNIFYLPMGFRKIYELVKQIKSSKAEILYINSFFDYQFSIIIALLAKFKVLGKRKIIIAPRGEFVDGCLKFKAKRKNIYLYLAKYFKIYENIFWHASTDQEKNEIKETLQIKSEKIYVALNIPRIGNEIEIKDIQKVHNSVLNIIFLSRISKEKNLPFALEILTQINREVKFDIYGPIEDLSLWEKCKKIIDTMPSNIKINYLGIVNRDLIRDTFIKYDLFFFPSFGENYAHVIVESLLSGTQVLISDNTPWRNLEDDLLGWDFNLNDKEKFMYIIENFQIKKSLSDFFNNKIQVRNSIIKRLNFDKVISDNLKLFN